MLIKKYFRPINFLLVGLMAWSAARLGVTLVSSHLEPPVRISPSSTVEPAELDRGVSGIQAFSAITRNNIFNPGAGTPAVRVAPKKAAKEIRGDDAENLPDTDLRVVLQGTVVAEDAAYSFAVIRDDAAGGKQKLLQPGEEIQGASLKAVLWRKVILERNGREEVLAMPEDDLHRKRKSGSPLVAGEVPSEEARGVSPDAVRQVDDQTYVVDRGEFEGMISNVNQFMTQLRVRPYFVNGKPAGYLVSDIRPGSVIEELGIRNGDILQGVNGAPITHPEQAFAAYQLLQQESELTLEIKRGPETHVFNYQLK